MGKIISQEEMQKIADLLKNYPKVVVIDDNVYDGSSFDNKFGTVLPKMHYIEEMKNRTISVYSAGKLLGATCMRSGWIIGAAPLISAARSVHQYNVYCQNHITENAVTHSLEELMKPTNTYKADIAKKLWKSRDILIR